MTPDDVTTRVAASMQQLAASATAIERNTTATLQVLRRLGRMMGVVYVFLAFALLGLGALAWQGYALHRANQDLHQQTRTVVQTNQALLTELLGRTPRQP